MIQLKRVRRGIMALGLLALPFGFPVPLKAQDTSPKITLKELLSLLESHTDLRFYYPDQWVMDSVAYLDPTSSTLLQDLNRQLARLRLTTIRVDQQIILVPDSIAVLTDFSEKYLARQVSEPALEAEAEAQVIIPGVNIIPERQINDNFKVFKIGTPADGSSSSAELKGQLLDQNNEPVPGVTVHVPILKSGTTTDINGEYSLVLPKGTHKVEYRAIGYVIEIRNIVLYGKGSLDVQLSEEVTQMQEVVVRSSKIDNINTVATGVEQVDPRLIKQIPVSLGEADLIKTLTMLPGVQNTGEISSGINVRGGSTDQNLILLNGAPILNTSHFFGFFSAFNPDILEEVTLYKSGAPARFGGRISSIIDIGLKQGDKSGYRLSGGISPVSAKILVHGPVVKDRSSFIINARTTYSDWLLNQVPDIQVQNSAAGFYDLQGVYQTKINEHNNLSLTGYYSRDRFDYYRESAFEYGNAAFTATWDHRRKESFASRYSVSFSRYHNSVRFQNDSTMFRQIDYNIDQWLMRADYSWSISNRHFLTFGLNATAYDVYPGKQTPFGKHSEADSKELDPEQGIEMALYLGDEFDLSPDLSLNVGVRLTSFINYGAKTEYQYSEGSTKSVDTQIGSTEYSKGTISSYYLNPELRMAARYRLNNLSSIKMSFQNMTQFIHLISNTLTSAPTDVWRLSDRYLKPQKGNQFSVGYYRNNRRGSVELSLEAFYKNLGRITDYKGGADLMVNEHLETELLQGTGRAYGMELLLRKKLGSLRGWVSYTYSRIQHRVNGPFPEEIINDGEYFPANYDKPNDFKLVANYKISRRLTMALNFIYTTGRPITYPVGFYRIANGNRLFYSARNQYRVPDYIRTDISATINGSLIKEKLNHSSLTFAVYNLMGRKNPYSIFFRSEQGVIKGYKMAIFGRPIFTITYNFKLFGNASDDY